MYIYIYIYIHRYLYEFAIVCVGMLVFAYSIIAKILRSILRKIFDNRM